MRRLFRRFYTDKMYIEMIVALVLFVLALVTDSMIEVIIYMLYFIIFLEIVRAVVNYIREQRVVLSLLVDAFIILTLREFIVNVVKINDAKIDSLDALLSSSLNFNLLILAGTLLFLMIIRFLAVKTSQRYLLKDVNKVD